MDVLHRDETMLRKPFFHEMIVFRLAILACPSCNSTNIFQPETIFVLIASQNGILIAHVQQQRVSAMIVVLK
jgi:hypothetical protein